MKIIIILVFILLGCTQRNNSEINTINEPYYQNEITNQENYEQTVEVIQQRQQYDERGRIVSFPYEMIVDDELNIAIHKNGVFKINDYPKSLNCIL
jgi:hypothetical protein